jgi:membrane associated rhomboid family serine protease
MGNRGSRSSGPQMQFNMMVPVTPVVRWLIGISVAIWLFGQVIGEGYLLHEPVLTYTFGMVPANFIQKFFLWEPLTYIFLHSRNVFHILFNMLLLWWLGAELESRWGSRFFLMYYLVSGIGAGIIYGFSVLFYFLIFGHSSVMNAPVVGASGAIFGLMLAYGIIFGERVVYFMMVFPMRAKYFVMLLGGVEAVTLLNNGMTGDVANLAHLGGLASGFLFLRGYTYFQQRKWRTKSDKRGRGLKLVVNNDKKDDEKGGGPRYWN